MNLTQQLAARCADDPEFLLCARYWTGTLRFELAGERIVLAVRAGVPSAGGEHEETGAGVTVSAPYDVWSEILRAVPQPYFNDIVPAQAFGLRISGDRETAWQYHGAIRRAVDLLRAVKNDSS